MKTFKEYFESREIMPINAAKGLATPALDPNVENKLKTAFEIVFKHNPIVSYKWLNKMVSKDMNIQKNLQDQGIDLQSSDFTSIVKNYSNSHKNDDKRPEEIITPPAADSF